MNRSDIPRIDRIKAWGMDTASRIGSRYPRAGGLFVGENPVHWHATNTRADEVDPWHVNESGIARSGRLARSYKGAVVLGADRDKLVNRSLENRTRPAAAFALGQAVLAAELYGAELQADNPQEDDVIRVGLRIGRGVLHGALGEYDPERNTFVPASPEDVAIIDTNTPADEVTKRYSGVVFL